MSFSLRSDYLRASSVPAPRGCQHRAYGCPLDANSPPHKHSYVSEASKTLWGAGAAGQALCGALHWRGIAVVLQSALTASHHTSIALEIMSDLELSAA